MIARSGRCRPGASAATAAASSTPTGAAADAGARLPRLHEAERALRLAAGRQRRRTAAWSRCRRTDLRARTFRATLPVDAAIEWINQRPADPPWMATVSFASAHTPLMQPPARLVGAQAAATAADLDCGDPTQQRVLREPDDRGARRRARAPAGRRTGLAQRGRERRAGVPPGGHRHDGGHHRRQRHASAPPSSCRSTSRAKGTAYQTGVWVPLVGRRPAGAASPTAAVTTW